MIGTDDPIAEARALLADSEDGVYWGRNGAFRSKATSLLQALIDLVPPEWVVVLGLCASCDHPFDDHEEDGECWAEDGCEGCGEYKPSRRYPPKPTREPAE